MIYLIQRLAHSIRRHSFAWIIVLLLAGVMAYVGFGVLQDQMRPRTTVRLGDGVFSAYLARTDAEREKGLGGVVDLPPTKAMLFVFPTDARHGIWMKDMRIPIDVVWLDKDKKVIYIVRDMRPTSPLETYAPEGPARYVLEMAAGVARQRNIKVGDVAVFELPEEPAAGEVDE